MFAKPAKKSGAQPLKQRALNKPKAVAVKSGVKPLQSKKTKLDSKSSKNKPPLRLDPGYSLYSTDSEDQVAASFREMEACEKILTHLKHKQKNSHQAKSKVKKSKEKSPGPRALNDVTPGSAATSIPGNNFQYGMSQFLHHIQDPNNPSNPLFNYRLVSSTPDPDKNLADTSRPLAHPDHSTQDVPERDISAVSSVLPSQQHVQNMTDMLEIYKHLEQKKYTQLQEASAMAELDRLKSQAQRDIQEQAHRDMQEQLSTPPASQPATFVGTGSLGFPVAMQGSLGFLEAQSSLPQTGSQPVSTDSLLYGFSSGIQNFQSPNVEAGRDSSLAAFQPYLARESGGFIPPHPWLVKEQEHVPRSQSEGDPSKGQQESLQHSKTSSIDVIPVQDIPHTDRTEHSGSTTVSGGTDYAMLPQPEKMGSGDKGQTQQSDGNIVYEKQNGLFQIHQKCETVSDTERTGKSDVSERGSIHEAPERDVPKFGEGTFNVEGAGTSTGTSQNLSDISTPRNQNSSAGSTSSQGGKIVFIPNDSNTPNVIGYVPGIPYIQSTSQPMSLQLSNDGSGSQVPKLTLGNQGQSTSQLTAQSGGQDVSGSGYSAVHAKIIAAGDIGVRKLRYLLKELRECSKVSKDVEIGRLVSELDEAVNAIPQLALTFNLQTEIDLAIQPLRTENSQLRRKLRLMNQQLKDKDIAAEEGPKDINFELLHLQTSSEALQKKLHDEQNIKTRLAAEVQYLYGEIHKLKVEKSKWIAEISEKETSQLKLRQETLLETQTLRHEVDLMRKDHEMTGGKVDTLDKENHILQVTLQQRDAEIQRQHDIIEEMKESIAELLQELDQSRGGDTTWDQNKSFGLHKLQRIVEEEGTRFTRNFQKDQTTNNVHSRSRTPERRKFDFNTTTSSAATTPRLTRAALAHHNRNNLPPSGARMGPDGRQGPASESELDTLVEMHRKERQQPAAREREVGPRRRTSSSSPVRLRSDPYDRYRYHQAPSYTRPAAQEGRLFDRPGMGQRRERTYGRERRAVREDSASPPQRRVAKASDMSPPQGRVYRASDMSPSGRDRVGRQSDMSPTGRDRRVARPSDMSPTGRDRRLGRPSDMSPTGRDRRAQGQREVYHTGRGATTELADRYADPSEVSAAQSRYSVTDYFRKYPQSSDTLGSEPRPAPTSPAKDQFYQLRTSSQVGERSVTFSEAFAQRNDRNLKQRTLFTGMNGDPTISVIHDDNVSSVSMNSVTTANTVDDTRFRNGIATLDANIAKLQMALQKTKSMLT